MRQTTMLDGADAPTAIAPSGRNAPRGGPVRVTLEHPRRRGHPLLWLLGIAVLAGVVAFTAAPFTAYWAICSAARYDDAAALSQLVDYDQVRASLRPQLIDPVGVRLARPPPNPFTDPLAAIQTLWSHRAWAPAVIHAPSPDVYLSPDALLRVLAGRGDARQPPGDQIAAANLKTPSPALAYFGWRRVRFVVRDPADARRETVLVLARGGGWFTWRLVAIVLPAQTAPRPA